MNTPLTDDEAIAAIRQLADRPWDQGSVKQCVVEGTLHALLGVLLAPGDALAAWLATILLSPDGPMAETTKDLDSK